jgi:hypothetical protein
MAIRGSCLCGGVNFEIDKAVGPVEFCHCNRCRKVSGSTGMLAIGVRTADFRLLSGRDLIRSFAAPILYAPPPYHSSFCSNCGSPVPVAEPEGEWFEIPVGTLDDDPGLRPDKHIFRELAPAWADLPTELPTYSIRELYKSRTGKNLPDDFELRTHQSPR